MNKEIDSNKNHEMDIKVKLSTLWIVVMFTMIFADILSFISPNFFQDMNQMQINQTMLLVFAILLEIPILMIFLSRYLNYKINRWTNVIASIITILFVIGGGSLYPHYIFFASVEIICLIYIIYLSYKWRK
ncbi:MAG: DUF6326 family protein [Candidatus Pacearchaeota archaeon]|jgi:H+/gluconate symporter-like permease